MSRRARGRRAWLITWDWAGPHAAVPERDVIAAILRPQTSADTVRRIVEILYAAREYDPFDKLNALTDNPYPSEFGKVAAERDTPSGEVFRQHVSYTGHIHCGHNPFLFARLVDDLRPADLTNPAAGLTWEERPPPGVIRL